VTEKRLRELRRLAEESVSVKVITASSVSCPACRMAVQKTEGRCAATRAFN
jgi:hypothetical protein